MYFQSKNSTTWFRVSLKQMNKKGSVQETRPWPFSPVRVAHRLRSYRRSQLQKQTRTTYESGKHENSQVREF